MTHKNPLQTLQDLAHTRVDEATKKLGDLIASERACEEKMQMLLQYRTEYRERFLLAAQNGIDPNAWRNYSAFLDKIDDAITQQQDFVNRSKKATQTGQQNWLSERNRAKALDTLADQQLLKQQHKEARQEQKFSDEHAAKKYHTHRES